MQEKRPDFPRRSASFNPEAETFSPAPAKIGAADIDTKLTPRMNSPQRLSVLEMYEEDSPFRPSREMRPNYQTYSGPSVPQLAGTQSDQLDMSFPDFHDMLHALNQAGNKAAQNPSTPMESIHIAAPYQSRCVEPTQRYAPSFSAPEVEELSTSLGLPGIVGKGKAGADDSTARPSNLPDFKSPASSNLHARFLNAQGVSDHTAIGPQNLHNYRFGVQNEREIGEDPPTRTVQPPPGFAGEHPREILEEDQSTRTIQPPPGFTGESSREIFAERRGTNFADILESQALPTGLSAFRHPRRFSDLQSAVQALQQKSHANRLPPKRVIRPRATTRTKRSDQGPEPSSADIYPDDAPYPSTRRPSYVPDPTLVFHDYSSHGRSFKPQDTTSWPTPAEVYSENPIQGPAHPSSSAKEDTEPGFDLFKDHYYPTDADIHEPDAEIDALLKAIPHLLDLHVPELKCDSCPLTPGQTDGSRYGMRFHGIGLGDRWMGPDLSGDPNIKVLW
ncbi:hypothetical protein PSV08DRAFT_364014 [Bipolaris maydis]|uniref:uncharacterized protein n=1 Tax=Cochliobolus heterostrophus TaxID=5016 RepID=UPI0024CFEE40|nr:hypothetical protein J3E73DRAFT_237205 [Bipolaris maydis]KAJ6269279.1 hypothetical protein PSV08DRAFT_364014 [Bipolaris maydis]KAJ6280092.1 hypothetical protein J3E71DRAFT_354925 [Bipolaris maydis]